MANPYRWLRDIVEMLEHGDSAEEFLEHTKLEMFSGSSILLHA